MDRRISHIDASRFTSDIHHARTIFIIPTLPFAEPTAFFSSLAAHGPPEVLSNTGKLLTYPAALLLNVDDNLQAAILKHIPPFWESDKENQGGTAYETEEKEWQALFNHLSEDAHFLAYKKDGFVKDENDEGYGYTDLSLWCAAWLGERGKTGNSEEGQKLRAARKRARYSSDSPQEDSDDDDDDDVSRRYKRSKTDEDVEIELGTQSAGSSETSREQRRGSRIMRPSNWPEE
ncbi:hypothetical protein DM02DRAFT_616595 [Periconia macrospinosa]|uniref:Uncharacterized protein n=1 Tax=Periconia macrospinosa TaxID=97972 RepID=A0A2V1DI20_9PLEO|nr:hypothetical protein DM02DRAFT_616595 [Periconia macrospinosa]